MVSGGAGSELTGGMGTYQHDRSWRFSVSFRHPLRAFQFYLSFRLKNKKIMWCLIKRFPNSCLITESLEEELQQPIKKIL